MSSNKIGQSLFDMTRFQLILPVDSHNATKNRTDHRMHVEGPQICQIDRWNNSFQNVYGMNRKKLTVWPGKLILCKKTPNSGQNLHYAHCGFWPIFAHFSPFSPIFAQNCFGFSVGKSLILWPSA